MKLLIYTVKSNKEEELKKAKELADWILPTSVESVEISEKLPTKKQSKEYAVVELEEIYSPVLKQMAKNLVIKLDIGISDNVLERL